MKPALKSFRTTLMGGLLGLVAACGEADAPSETDVSATLDAFHEAASEADGETYFSLFAENGVFLGTDKSERWPVEAFQAYADPIFSEGRGWTYVMYERHVDFAPDGKTAWFDELLQNKSYGTSRGTGVLIKTSKGWKITQYHLTFPIPNALAGEFTKQIKALEATR
jgi:ketosteroid isomerase-like protein